MINLSFGAPVTASYRTDPLSAAVQIAWQRGLVVVAASGNAGRDAQGHVLYGGIAAPGNAPWVLTVGASSHMGTVSPLDDTVAGFSSRGPGAIDYIAAHPAPGPESRHTTAASEAATPAPKSAKTRRVQKGSGQKARTATTTACGSGSW